MTYTFCKKVIENGTYGTKDAMMTKLDVFLLNSRITQEQYNELVGWLNAQQTYVTQEEQLNSVERIPVRDDNGTFNGVIDKSKIEEEIKSKITERLFKDLF